jgi:hypothetical protein
VADGRANSGAARFDDLRAGEHGRAGGAAKDKLRAAGNLCAASVPPALTFSVPPLRTTVGSATPLRRSDSAGHSVKTGEAFDSNAIRGSMKF